MIRSVCRFVKKLNKGTFIRKKILCNYLAGYPAGYRISGQISIRCNPKDNSAYKNSTILKTDNYKHQISLKGI